MLEHTDHTGSVWRFLPSGHMASCLGKEQDTYIVRHFFFLHCSQHLALRADFSFVSKYRKTWLCCYSLSVIFLFASHFTLLHPEYS